MAFWNILMISRGPFLVHPWLLQSPVPQRAGIFKSLSAQHGAIGHLLKGLWLGWSPSQSPSLDIHSTIAYKWSYDHFNLFVMLFKFNKTLWSDLFLSIVLRLCIRWGHWLRVEAGVQLSNCIIGNIIRSIDSPAHTNLYAISNHPELTIPVSVSMIVVNWH